MLKKLIYFASSSLALIGICYFIYRSGGLEEHCNCVDELNQQDTIDLSAWTVIVDESRTAPFQADIKTLKQDVGPFTLKKDDIIICGGLMYQQNQADTTKYCLLQIGIVSTTDRASVKDKKMNLEFDFEFQIRDAMKYFKRSTECMNCSNAKTHGRVKTGHSFSVACINGPYTQAKFYFKDQFLESITLR